MVPNQVARISNHVYWHDKSALREGLFVEQDTENKFPKNNYCNL